MKPHTSSIATTLVIALFLPALMGERCAPAPVVHEVVTDDYTLRYWRDGSERIDRTRFRYAFSVTLTPHRADTDHASAVATSASPTTLIEAGDLAFGNVLRGETVTATTQLQVLQERSEAFDPSQIAWRVILPSAYDFGAFEDEIEAWMAGTPGIEGVGAILVDAEDGVIFERSFGVFDDDRVYLIASSSKMVSAGVLAALEDQGLLDMDAPVNEVVDWGDEHNPEITPAQLVSNTSGLPGLFPFFAPYTCQYRWNGLSLSECGEVIFTTPRDDGPGQVVAPDSEFRYGGGQWQVAGAVAEIASGKSWAQLIEEIYVEPCGLEAFGFNNHFLQAVSSGGGAFDYPPGFGGDLATLSATDNPNMEGGAYTTIGDYAKLLLMHLRGGMCGVAEVLSEAAIDRLHSDRLLEVVGGSTGGGWQGYGYGWWHERDGEPLLVDPGAYGAVGWLDEVRGFGGFLVMEADSTLGTQLFQRVLPLAREAHDEVWGGP